MNAMKRQLITQTDQHITKVITHVNSGDFIKEFDEHHASKERILFEQDCAILGENWKKTIKAVLPSVYVAELEDLTGNQTRRLIERSYQAIFVGGEYEALQLRKAATCAALIKCDDLHFKNNHFRLAMYKWVRRLEAAAMA